MSKVVAASWLERWRERWRAGPGFTSLLFGVWLPAGTIGLELATGECANLLFDPIPTPLHLLLVSLVPALNLLVWMSLTRPQPKVRWLALCNGVAIGIAAFYSFLFLPVLPLATVAIILFGLGLLPWAPVLALVATLSIRQHLKRAAIEAQTHYAMWPGLLFGFLALIAVDLPSTLTTIGMKLATSPSVLEQRRGLRMLRAVGNEAAMLRLCYVRTGRSTDMFSFISGMSSISPLQAREIYYRVTGKPFNTQAPPENLRRQRDIWADAEFDFDSDQGMGAVGGRLRGLSLASSAFDGSIDAQGNLGYLEWTLVMKNEASMMREARAQVALPPGAVVSRLTLWINGEEREAAFAARGQVTAAYRGVVQQRRDPVLVTTAGADRIAVQMFPVPPHDEMKVRIGMTLPLQIDHPRQGAMQLPYFHERNFNIADDFKHEVWLEAKTPLQAAGGASSVTSSGAHSLQFQLGDEQLHTASSIVTAARDGSDRSWSHDKPAGTTFIKQTLQLVPASRPSRIVVVVDSSLSMASSAQSIAASLSRFPAAVELFLIVADDGLDVQAAPQPTTPAHAAALLRNYEFVGGKDNTAALARALDVASGDDSALIWIHGPQPVVLHTTSSVERRLQRRGSVQWYDVQTIPGPNRIGERLEESQGVKTLSLRQLEALFARWRSGGTEVIVRRERVDSTQPPGPVEAQTSDHLARLWANDEVRRLFYAERDSRQSAVELAHRYQLVTPVTGAVVLETQQQYDAAGLTPVPEGTVPSIPEPEEWVLIAIALALLLYACRRKLVRQHAAI